MEMGVNVLSKNEKKIPMVLNMKVKGLPKRKTEIKMKTRSSGPTSLEMITHYH
jgi:hypothetical protein